MIKWKLIFVILSISSTAQAGSFEECANKLGLRWNAEKKTLIELSGSIYDSSARSTSVTSVKLWTPAGVTTIEPGTNGCNTDRQRNVWSRIIAGIDGIGAALPGSKNPNAAQQKQQAVEACSGIDSSLDQALQKQSKAISGEVPATR